MYIHPLFRAGIDAFAVQPSGRSASWTAHCFIAIFNPTLPLLTLMSPLLPAHTVRFVDIARPSMPFRHCRPLTVLLLPIRNFAAPTLMLASSIQHVAHVHARHALLRCALEQGVDGGDGKQNAGSSGKASSQLSNDTEQSQACSTNGGS